MRLIRTFHPVGQGAFYTERHNIDGHKFNIVYDCGSDTLTAIELERKIHSEFVKGEIIDLLFISHFHADHINGIEILKNHCNIKTVVMPLLDNREKILVKVLSKLRDQTLNPELIDSPDSFFGPETNIVTVDPITLDDTENIDTPPIIIDKNNSGANIKSGVAISPSHIHMDHWHFIPYNYNFETASVEFETALNAEGLTLADIDSITKINKHKTSIVSAYHKVKGYFNNTSLILFSGPRNNNDFVMEAWYEHSALRYNHYIEKPGCLYLGDLSLKIKDITNNIRKRINKLYSNIGIIQIPHHGSIHNFCATILDGNQLGIISYGTDNTYGHPSDLVIGEIMTNDCIPCLVSENKDSVTIQVLYGKKELVKHRIKLRTC